MFDNKHKYLKDLKYIFCRAYCISHIKVYFANLVMLYSLLFKTKVNNKKATSAFE